ncbi:MAG: hypothetical protein PHP13_06460 [Methanomicrobium sp.]|nr:hypothetical protein [Methanomicrobium sp.]
MELFVKDSDDKLTETEYKVLLACEIPRSTKELLEITRLKNRDHFRKNVIATLIERELLFMVDPKKPKSPLQKYITSKKGQNILIKDKNE